MDLLKWRSANCACLERLEHNKFGLCFTDGCEFSVLKHWQSMNFSTTFENTNPMFSNSDTLICQPLVRNQLIHHMSVLGNQPIIILQILM